MARCTRRDSERPAMLEADVAQQLRHRFEDAAHLARSLAGLDNRGQHLQRAISRPVVA